MRSQLLLTLKLSDKLNKREYEKWQHLKLNVPADALKFYIAEMTKKGTWVSGNKKWLDLVWFFLCSTDVLITNITEVCRFCLFQLIYFEFQHEPKDSNIKPVIIKKVKSILYMPGRRVSTMLTPQISSLKCFNSLSQ